VILDAKGKSLITSDGPDGKNIGFPAEDQEIAHFAKMLEATKQRITEKEREELCKSLKDLEATRKAAIQPKAQAQSQ
jgi:hypothetical protein